MRFVVLAAVSALAVGACAANPEPVPAKPAAGPVIVGGYAPADTSSPGYAEAEALAIKTIYDRDPQRGLVTSKSAQVQVVAGLNYRFEIVMSSGQKYHVTVYRDLQGNLSVTNYMTELPPK